MNNQKVNIFSQIPTVDIQRNLFERNHTWKGTLDGGYLYPVFFDEVLPGDTKKLNTTFFGRFATPIVPIMDNVYLDYHLWFVPRRLTWSNWKKFMGERKNPNDSIDYLIPQVESGSNGFPRYSYMDYLGIPPTIANLSVDAQYFRSLLLIWNENYRDENLQASIPIPEGDGPDPLSLYTNFKYDINGNQQTDTDGTHLLLKRGKRMDYFTTGLPQPQKGPGVDLPLTGTIPVYGDGTTIGLTNGSQNAGTVYVAGSGFTGLAVTTSTYGQPTGSAVGSGTINQKSLGLTTDGSKSGIVADLSEASVITINTLRQAFALQQFLELEARGGSRYIEIILNFFGVRSPDYRLQRPEYLGGGTSMLNVTTVAQTSSTDSTTPQGNLSAYATIASTGNGFAQSFTEHGIILGLVSIRTDLNYQQGIDRHFSRKTRYDFYWPQFAHIGEQAILNKEIYAQGTNADNGTFAYQERYAEYRYKNNYITGKFRSSDPQTLDYWHLGQDFQSLPMLNQEFIQENPPFDRVIAVQDEPQFLLDVYHEYDDMRPVSLYGTPGLRRM